MVDKDCYVPGDVCPVCGGVLQHEMLPPPDRAGPPVSEWVECWDCQQVFIICAEAAIGDYDDDLAH